MMQSDPRKILATASQSLECFGLAMMPGFEVAPHHKLIIDHIERLLRGKSRKTAIICPPRHGKSTLCSIITPAYYLGKSPAGNVICASYGADLSESFGRRVRNIISSPMYASIFPNARLSPDSSAMHRFNTTRGGEANFVGRGGALTGKGASLLILDDLIKDQEEARSDIVCRSVIDWLQHVAFTRLSRDARVIAIATRWSERDPMGWLLQQQGWDVLHLPAISEGGNDPLSRPVGAPLWESTFPLPALQSIRSAVGPAVWQALYQGNPRAAQGSIFRREWFRHYREMPASFTKIIQSWDTAFKTGASNDFSVCTTWAATENAFFLLSMWRGKVEFPELKRQVVLQAEAWRPHAIIVEDKASGQSLIQELRDATTFPLMPVKVDSDKISRTSAVTAFFEAGKVFFPETAAWLTDLEDELAGFPGALHDDIVDSVTQALNHLRGGSGILGVLELLKRGFSGFVYGPLQTQWQAAKRNFNDGLNSRSQALETEIRPPDSCPRCGHREMSEVGTGTSTRYLCGRCGQYSGAEEEQQQRCPACGGVASRIGSTGFCLRCVDCGYQFFAGAPPEIIRPNRRNLGRFKNPNRRF